MVTVTPRLTFRNHDGHWCRQFRVDRKEDASEQIACREQGSDWALAERVEVSQSTDPLIYHTASGAHVLDDAIDRIITGVPAEPEQEVELINNQWRRN